MKKIYKYRERKKYEDLSLILNDKSDYLKNLEKKRNDGIKIIKNQKASLMIEDILKINKFNRNYSCFPFNSGNESVIGFNKNKNISQIVNYPFKPKIIKKFSNKKINTVEIEKLPAINNYSQMPKKIYKIRYAHNFNNNRNKFLSKAGQDIIGQNDISQSNIKLRHYKSYKNI